MLSRFGKTIVFLLTPPILVSAQTVPAGARIAVRTNSQITSATAQVGQSFKGSYPESVISIQQVAAAWRSSDR